VGVWQERARRTRSASAGRTSSDRRPNRLDPLQRQRALDVACTALQRKRSFLSRPQFCAMNLSCAHNHSRIREYVKQSAARHWEMQSNRAGGFETQNGLTVRALSERRQREIRTPPRCAAVGASSSRVTAKPAAARSEPSSRFFPGAPAAQAPPAAPQPLRQELRPALALFRGLLSA